MEKYVVTITMPVKTVKQISDPFIHTIRYKGKQQYYITATDSHSAIEKAKSNYFQFSPASEIIKIKIKKYKENESNKGN